jgi:hypothetical protein
MGATIPLFSCPEVEELMVEGYSHCGWEIRCLDLRCQSKGESLGRREQGEERNAKDYTIFVVSRGCGRGG